MTERKCAWGISEENNTVESEAMQSSSRWRSFISRDAFDAQYCRWAHRRSLIWRLKSEKLLASSLISVLACVVKYQQESHAAAQWKRLLFYDAGCGFIWCWRNRRHYACASSQFPSMREPGLIWRLWRNFLREARLRLKHMMHGDDVPCAMKAIMP